VLNKHDTVSAEQRGTVHRFVGEQLDRFFGPRMPPIVSVCSTDGLQAKLSGDEGRLEASGIPELEKQLFSFLLTEKSHAFLVQCAAECESFCKNYRGPSR
jgi:hypothetical protein